LTKAALHRSTRRLSLTSVGETYLNRVRAILQYIDEAHGIASSQTLDMAGVLRLLAPPVLATHILGPLIAGFRQLYPKIVLDIEVASFRELPIEDYDITLMPTADTFDGNVIARKIIASEAILVASPGYLQRRGTPATPQDLARHDVLRLRVPGASTCTPPSPAASSCPSAPACSWSI
jgi:DNA-binding transcriptional LysR family regulator